MCAQASDFGHQPNCQGLSLSGGAARLIYWRMLDSPAGLSGISQRRHGGLLEAQVMDGIGVRLRLSRVGGALLRYSTPSTW